MDKLQPIIKQRFWILLGLSLILAFFAFFKNQSAIVAATTAREDALKATLGAIPAGTEPNPTYAEGLKKINTAYKSKIEQAVDELYANQRGRMTWPEQILKELPKDPNGVPLYRDKEKGLSTVATRTYAKIYKDVLIEELWKKAEPVVEQAPPQNTMPGVPGIGAGPNRSTELLRGITAGTIRPRGNARTSKYFKGQTVLYGQPGHPPLTWQQKVYIDRQAVPQKVLPSIPSAEQVWDCQEDIWFTDLIFEAVRRINKDADNVRTSPLKLISKIELRGGAGAGAAADAGMMGMEGMEGEDMSGMEAETMMADAYGAAGLGGLGGDMGMGGPGGMLAPPPTEFDPAEVFGPEAVPGAMSMDASSEDAGADSGMEMGMGMGMAALPQALRWVALTDGAKFRERGFYLSVIINQQKIPDFLVYLCESEWPTKVLKFQMGPNPYRKNVAAGAMSGMYGGGYDPVGGGAYEGGGAGGYGAAMNAFAGASGFSSFGGMGSTGMEDAMGMMGMGGFGFMPAANRFPGGPPQFAFTNRDPFNGTLNEPDLVQLDIAGIITFYVSADAAADTTAAEAVDTPSAPGGEEALLQEAAKQAEEAKKAEAEKAADGATPMPPATPPATGTAPATPVTTPPAETPAVTPAPPAAPEATVTPPAEVTPPATAPPAEAAPPAAETPAAPGT